MTDEEQVEALKAKYSWLPADYVWVLATSPDLECALARIAGELFSDLRSAEQEAEELQRQLAELDREFDVFKDNVARRLQVLEQQAGVDTIVETLLGKGN